jgi:hypothetical protein
MSDDLTMQRLDKQIEWYSGHAAYNQWLYRTLKVVVIVAAALIPFLSGMEGVRPQYVGALGVLIAIAEGIQQLNQHHANWISFRATAEALKNEKYLYLAKAGPYAEAKDAHALLAERVVSLLSQETAKWKSVQESVDKKPGGSDGRDKR